ncbi:MAG: lamin tail domain-containing protein [Verrucomicrobia bacterium]|nr:lamin tail domain-containing protein [Verrucomicrobiota bacterium]
MLWLLAGVGADAEIVISQIYGGGGNSGALYQNDFVEIFNRGNQPVSLLGWSIQYSSSAGTSWQIVTLQGEVGAGRHFLVQLASGGVNGLPLPTADTAGTINLSATGGKVALVRTTVPLSGACPESDAIADLVGYGTSASCFEGTGPAPVPSSTLAVIRSSNGCLDTGDNAADFFTSAPAPRNLQSAASPCDSVTTRALHEIQGAGATSPLAGQTVVTTTNVITALTSDGFFLQAVHSEVDGDANTSEGIFVSTPDALPALAQIGNAVMVTAFVEEYRPASDPASPTRTQLINPVLTLVATSQPLPSPALLTKSDWGEVPSLDGLERWEGMRVSAGALTVVSATEGFIQEASAVGISDGVFYAAPTGVARPQRELGIPFWIELPAEAPPGVARFDGNPERLRVDSNAQPGARRLEVVAGAVVNGLTGVLDFQRRTWTVLPDASSVPTVSGNRAADPVAAAATNEILVASLNLQRFFDTEEDPEVLDVVLTPSAFAGRLSKASLTIRNILRGPDILGVVEVENLPTLQAIADRVNADLAASGKSSPRYDAFLIEGNDIGGIDVGFLVNTARVEVVEVLQVGKDATYVNPETGNPSTLNDRPPLVLRARVAKPGTTNSLSLTVVQNHLRSMSGIDDPADGGRTRAKRRAQAEYLARLIQERQTLVPSENVVVMGDFNAFEFNDGYVDVMGTIKGTPTPATEVTLASADLVNPDLVNLTDLSPATERYSYSFDGNVQAIDHILVNSTLRPRVTRHGYARGNVDFPESFRSDFNRPERISDHDAAVVWLALTIPPKVLSATVVNGQIELRLQAEPQQSLRVESSSDLVTWQDTGEIHVADDGDAIFSAPLAEGSARRFFRLAIP